MRAGEEITTALSPALELAPARVLVERRDGGELVLRSAHPLGEPARHVSERLRHWAAVAPDRDYLVERARDGGLRRVTYAEARRRVDALAQALLDRGLSAATPLMILSDNGIDHALLALGAMQAGVPVAPVSAAYSLISNDFAKLRAIHALLAPRLIYADDGDRYARALDALGPEKGGAEIVISRGGYPGATSFESLAATASGPGIEVEAALAALGPDSVAKILFTSGSTGQPKGVINTQRMLCSNQEAIVTLWPFLRARPPVVVDWLPWSHTFGANHNFNLVLFHGGTLVIDDGKPAPGLIDRSVAMLREISPTLYFNVPRGFDMLLPYLERDEALRAAFFRDLDVVFYAAASLPNPLWERMEACSIQARGEPVRMLSAWGLTETSPMATSVHFPIERAGVIGLPAPGTAIKFVPTAGKFELRVQGPNVTPGYWKRPDLTALAFDEEGYFRTGDAARLLDPDAPERGIVFDGRIAEDFKLTTGTWVHVGQLRTQLVAAAAPLVEDAVLAGLDRDALGLLIFLSPAACQAAFQGVPPDTLGAHPALRGRLAEALRAHNHDHPGSSHRIARALILTEPPSIDAGEITDKGYINQRAVLARRAALVEALYSDDPAVLVL
jgi:feruloyl-CoA synthase